MKNAVKILALILVLTLFTSVLVTSSIFAVGEEKSAGPLALQDINAVAPSLKNQPADMTLVKKTADNGVPYYTLSYTNGWGVENGGYPKVPYLQFGAAKHYLKNGWYTNDTAEGVDNTDYLVIDLDLSTDTNQFDQIYFQTCFYYGKKTAQTDGSYKGVRTSAQAGHYALIGDKGDKVHFTENANSTVTEIPVELTSDNEWSHVTMVVDATTEKNRMMHLYYNGQYIASRICMTDNGIFLESLRISLGTDKIAPDLNNESFSVANVTVKSFPYGYTGELAREKDNLGNVLYPLSSFSDLSYCLDNLPENTVAEITHEDSTVSRVTKISDLDGNLKAGDSVKLFRDIPRKIVIPGKLEGENVVPAVDFDLNGHSMVTPLVLSDYDYLDWIIRNSEGELYSYVSGSETVYAKGSQVYADGKLTEDGLYKFLSTAFPTGIGSKTDIKITFLKDTSVKYTAAFKHGESSVTYDLNKNTLSLMAGCEEMFCSASAKSQLIIRDGKLINNASSPIYLVNAARYYLTDVELVANSSFCDQRSGSLYFVNSKITTSATLTSLKSHSGNSCYTVLDGCEMSATSNPISFSNLRTSSARRGSMNNFAGIYNTKVSGTASIIEADYFANEWTAGDSVALSNKNNVTLSIQGSNVNISGEAPFINLEILTLTNLSYVFAEGFSANADIYIDKSEIAAYNIVSANDDDASASISKHGVTVGAYTMNTNVSVYRSSLKSAKEVFRNTVGKADENGALTAFISDGIRLSSIQWSSEGDSAVNVEMPEGVRLAYSYEVEYPYIATSEWTESSIVGNRPDKTTVKMSPLFSNGMVLQGNKEINIYGTCASIGSTIEVTLGDKTASTTVMGDGKWSVTLPPMEYQNGLTLTINEVGVLFPETKFEDVHIGEIWLMAGQSNSVYGVYKMEDFAEYKSNANNFDNIYAFAIHQTQSLIEKTESSNSGWYKVNAGSMSKDDRYTGISAIAYVMASRLATELGGDVAVGIIDANFNGSTVEAWMSPENLEKVDPELNEKYNAYRNYYEENGVYPAESDVSKYGSYIASGKLYQRMPCACYNGMLAPFFDGFSIRGAVWYQGEGNASSVTADSDGDYTKHFNGVRNTLRDVFADAELPVFIIQIPARMGNPFYFRALQYDLAKNDENTYIVAFPHAGSTFSENELKYTTPESDSMVHYERKSPVGLALAESIFENVYGFSRDSAPNILSIVKDGNSIVITFDRELTTEVGTEMLGFEIAGADRNWVAAKATYSNKTVTLTAEGLTSPDRVRYNAGLTSLILEDGTELIYNQSYGSFSYDEAAGTVTITANGNVYVIDTSDPAVVGVRMEGNVVATNGSALPIFLAIAD